ncbi:hypothetical protein DERP_000628 [Dermatophagoides pteronyssinus]|uniref:Uncharacterized protein n=1 Tax=Dermatophagoides pteronyssinus TaxID=6956 RepID=A0ABQ8J0P7_DERPT|nr:hypothetical protein DERP_000628 [Dermatophagoides pteronyssinus]
MKNPHESRCQRRRRSQPKYGCNINQQVAGIFIDVRLISLILFIDSRTISWKFVSNSVTCRSIRIIACKILETKNQNQNQIYN